MGGRSLPGTWSPSWTDRRLPFAGATSHTQVTAGMAFLILEPWFAHRFSSVSIQVSFLMSCAPFPTACTSLKCGTPYICIHPNKDNPAIVGDTSATHSHRCLEMVLFKKHRIPQQLTHYNDQGMGRGHQAWSAVECLLLSNTLQGIPSAPLQTLTLKGFRPHQPGARSTRK